MEDKSLHQIIKIITGGWYPRTQLHLAEVYKFFNEGESDLELSKQKLKEFHKRLNLLKVEKEAADLEYVKAETNNGLTIKYFEDGLYTIETASDDIEEAQKKLDDYVHNAFEPAISYLFSLGAPLPKILAHLEPPHPPKTTVIGITSQNLKDFTIDKEKFGEIYDRSLSSDITVLRTTKCFFIIALPTKKDLIENIANEEIFFREFETQLRKYLNLHRTMWEKVAAIKNKEKISAKEADMIRDELDKDQETINLITARLHQMKIYVATRAKIAKSLKIDQYLSELFQYEFETLLDAHQYIEELWQMNKDQIASAIQLIVEVKNQSVERSIQALKLITIAYALIVVWVYTNKEELHFSSRGLFYSGLVIVLAWLINVLVNLIFQHQKYHLKFRKR